MAKSVTFPLDNMQVQIEDEEPRVDGMKRNSSTTVGEIENEDMLQVSSLSVQIPTTDLLISTQPVYPAPPAYLVRALFVTLCCCMPLGAVALMKSSQVKHYVAVGDAAAAHRASFEARQWTMAAMMIGIAFILLGSLTYIVLFAVIILTSE